MSLVLRDGSVHRVPVPRLEELSAVDVLTHSALFGTDLYTAETAELLRRYEALVSLGPEQRTDTETGELNTIAKDLTVMPTITATTPGDGGGDTEDDRDIAADIVRQFGLAKS